MIAQNRFSMNLEEYRKAVVYGFIQSLDIDESIDFFSHIRENTKNGNPFVWTFDGIDCELSLPDCDRILEIMFDIKEGKEVDFNLVKSEISKYNYDKEHKNDGK
jgi:hypothetical protein